jgi:hypothetical protein
MADDLLTASPGYAAGQQLRALQTLQTHPDPTVRARAMAKIQRWQAVIDGMGAGTLHIGDRAPVADVPVWATLEVAHGGFATGSLLAETPLDAAETALLNTLAEDAPGATPRSSISPLLQADEPRDRSALASALASSAPSRSMGPSRKFWPV